MAHTHRTRNPDPIPLHRVEADVDADVGDSGAPDFDEATLLRLDALDARLWAAARRTGDPQEAVHAAREFADDVFVALVFAAGSGVHAVNCSVPTPDGTLTSGRDLRMSVLAEVAALSYARDGADVEVRELFALAHVTGAPATAIMRSRTLDAQTSGPRAGGYTVRGWRVSTSGTEPLDAAGMFAFCCSEATSGEPLPIDPATRYADAVPLAVHADGARGRGATGGGIGPQRAP